VTQIKQVMKYELKLYLLKHFRFIFIILIIPYFSYPFGFQKPKGLVYNIQYKYPFKKKADSLFQLAKTCKNPKKRITILNKEKNLFEKHKITTPLYYRTLTALGISYHATNQLDSAIYYHQKAITNKSTNSRTIISYLKLGECYFQQGEYYKALLYNKKTILLSKELTKNNLLFNAYINRASILNYFKKESFTNARFYYLKKAQKLLKTTTINGLQKSKIFYQLGMYYRDSKPLGFNLAKKQYLLALSYAKENNSKKQIGIVYNALGNLYIATKKDSALYFLNKAKKYRESKYINFNMIDAFMQQHKTDKAIRLCNTTLNTYCTNAQGNYTNTKFTVHILTKKATVLITKFQKTTSNKYLNQALTTLLEADRIIDTIKQKSEETGTKMFWSKLATPVYEKIIYCSKTLNNTSLAFDYIEKNKALLLSEKISTEKALTKLSPETKNEYKQLNKTILTLEERIHNNTQTKNKDSLQEKLFDAKLLFETKFNSIHKTVATQLLEKQLSLQEAQEQLANDEAVISYFWNSNNTRQQLYILYYSHNKSKIIAISSQGLKHKIRNYLKHLQKPFATKQEASVFLANANDIYHTLFPTELLAVLNEKKIQLIATDLLQLIPFESLVVNPKNKHYLIYDYTISYLYSYNFHEGNKQRKNTASKSLLAFAPIHFSYDSLRTLQYTAQEVNAISKQFASSKYLNKEATKEQFLKQCSQYNIIHLATHAAATNKTKPWIAFYDSKLKLYELYTMQLQADLVTLSACKTNQGELATGEGVLSLSRGFFAAGTQSVVSSLWQADDQATSSIMETFYSLLKNGKTKASALQQAKITYLNTHSLSEVSPYYWASFVLTGDAKKLQQLPNNTTVYHYTLIVFLLMIILLLTYKQVFQKK